MKDFELKMLLKSFGPLGWLQMTHQAGAEKLRSNKKRKQKPKKNKK